MYEAAWLGRPGVVVSAWPSFKVFLMFSSLITLFGDGRALPILAGVIALIVIAGLAVGVYRLAFASRLRVPGGARGRAPRLGVVDVFGLDGQRQLVIVRRDNVEHLLLLGGPNDIVVEPNILRSTINGRDPAREPGKPEASAEPAAPIPAPAAPPRAAAALRRDPAPRPATPESPAQAAPTTIPAETRPRPALALRSIPETLRESLTLEPQKFDAKPVVAPEPLEPVAFAEPVRPVEPPRRAAQLPLPAPRPPLTSARPTLPPPITPTRARTASEPTVGSVTPAPSDEVAMVKPVVPGALPAPLPVTVKLAEAPEGPVKPNKDDSFYDPESVEAEMARLLGLDP